MQLVISQTGSVRCIYDEELDLHRLGQVTICRGSFVEPDVNSQWSADLAPVNGPVLGSFKRRSDALEAERAWLIDHWM